ncbi:hypothetical protein D3C81_2233310 [compost metagenome]
MYKASRTKKELSRNFEQEITELEQEIAAIEAQIIDENDWSIYENQLYKQQQLQKELEECYNEWLRQQ